jgi:ribonuclease E
MGVIRSVESLALAILRLIGEEARKDRTAKVIAQLPVDVATYLMNEKREWLHSIETRSGVDVILVPNRYLETPAYELRRVRDDELGLPEYSMISHQMAVQPQVDLDAIAAEEKAPPPPPVPAVTTVVPSTPAPPPAPEPTVATPVAVAAAATAVPQYGPRDGVFVRAWHWLFGDKRAPEPVAPPAKAAPVREPQRGDRDRSRDRDRGRGGDRERGRDRDRDARPGARGEPRRDARRDEARTASGSAGVASGGGERRDGERRPERRDERSRRPDQQQQRERRPEGQQQQRAQQQPRTEQPRPEQSQGQPAAAVVPMPVTGQEPPAAPQQASDAAGPTSRPERTDRPDRVEGERTGRRSRRGGRRRRREPGESPMTAEPPVPGEPQADGSQGSAPEPRSFDFDREPPRPAFRDTPASAAASVATPAPAIPVTAVEPRPEWTPTPPSDATREGPRSEP